MTNSEYIKANLSDRDLAYCMREFLMGQEEPVFIKHIRNAWAKWAQSTSSNDGNMAKGKHGSIEISENPSIWYWEKWAYPDGQWRQSGRSHSVAWQVWLSEQYNPLDWQEEEDE